MNVGCSMKVATPGVGFHPSVSEMAEQGHSIPRLFFRGKEFRVAGLGKGLGSNGDSLGRHGCGLASSREQRAPFFGAGGGGGLPRVVATPSPAGKRSAIAIQAWGHAHGPFDIQPHQPRAFLGRANAC